MCVSTLLSMPVAAKQQKGIESDLPLFTFEVDV